VGPDGKNILEYELFDLSLLPKTHIPNFPITIGILNPTGNMQNLVVEDSDAVSGFMDEKNFEKKSN